MGFMNSYKRLDCLCKERNGIGVTGYIESMERIPNGQDSVVGWKDDYYKLKHYRHIRNRIAHETDADEETLCSPQDAAWIENFYQRILAKKDPLAFYHSKTANLYSAMRGHDTEYRSTQQTVNQSDGCAIMMISAVAIILLILLALFL